jgi:mercuric ion binding protein
MRRLLLMIVLGVCVSTAALAGELKTITLDVDKMTCNMCPITVKKALKALDGVAEVDARYEGNGTGWAKVTYDPAKVKIDDLTFATEMAGYPSREKQ